MNVPIIDCHVHLIYPDQFSYSWTSDVPELANRAFRYEEYLRSIAGCGEIRAIFMESAPDEADWTKESKLICALADNQNSIFDGLILNCRPELEEEFSAYIESIKHPKLVGLRRILHVMPDDTCQSSRFVRNIQQLAAHNLTFDLCFLARQLPLAYQLARGCPEVQFVLDHCGVPDIAGGDLDLWREAIRSLVELPNVACKISGLLAYCAPGDATIETVRPYVEHCIESFGWHRVLWGSDWPVICSASSVAHWIEISRELVAREDPENQHKLFHANAERIYLKRSTV